MRAVACFTNFWHWSGGMAQYVIWNGGGQIPFLIGLLNPYVGILY